MIRVGGFSGTVDTTWVADALTMTGKLNGGAPCVATSHKSETIAEKEISTVVENSGKHCFTGPTIHEEFDLMPSVNCRITKRCTGVACVFGLSTSFASFEVIGFPTITRISPSAR